MSNNIINVTDSSFEQDVLKAAGPVLVDFWAEWCGPCKMIGPILEQVSEKYSGQLLIAKINIDHNSDTPAKYGIRGIPTLLLITNGQVVATQVGALSRQQLENFIDANL